MTIFTIGFTKKSARRFFDLLRASGAQRIIDVRLNNASQLAGFTKREDLSYFLHEIVGMEYVHLPQLAPTRDMLNDYRKGRISWETYEILFIELLQADRRDNSCGPRQQRLSTVQRRPAPTLSSPACCGVSQAAMGRCGHRSSRAEGLSWT